MAWKSLSLLLLCIILHAFAQGQVTVDFTVDKMNGCSSVQSQFEDLSTSSAGNITSWLWDLGGVTSDLEDPGRIFASVGSYEICLTVTDEKGNQSSLCKQDYIEVYDVPTADFTVDVSVGCTPLLVNYKDLSTSANGGIVNWVWGLNGSNGILETSNSSMPIFSNYEQADTYTISLSVEDDKGCSNSITKTNLVTALGKPNINIGTTEPIGCSFPMTVEFENLGAEEAVSYTWDFGNGEVFEGAHPSPTVYQSEGNYDVKIIAVNTVSTCTDTLFLSNYINTGGSILFDFYPKLICPKGSVQFEDLSPIEAESWEWDFGDGLTSSDRDPSHQYEVPGTYTISLSRKTAECEGVQVSQFEVEVESNPSLDYEIVVENNCKLPARVDFTEFSGDAGRYIWYIGTPGAYDTIAQGEEVTYDFRSFGSYDVRLLKESEAGCRTVALLDTVVIEPLQISLIGKNEGCVPFTADLGITSNSASPISEILWNVDGPQQLTSNESTISIPIDQVANYELEVSVVNEAGCVDTIKGDDILRGGIMPEVDFGLADDEVCPRELISFVNTSTGPANEWLWTFNDSTFNFDQNAEMTFTTPGNYNVSLEVGHNGCYASITKDSLFLVNFPGVGFDLEYNCDNPYQVKAVNTSSDFDSLVWSYSFSGDTTFLPLSDSVVIDFPDKSEYVVSLEAFNFENGCENIAFDTIVISDPRADFLTSTVSGCAPLDISFTDQSVDAISYQYFTEVGRFNDDTIADPAIRIHPPGEYAEIGLVVTGYHGCTDTTYSAPILVNAVSAQFETPEPVCIGDTLEIPQNSTSLFSDIVEYKWILGSNLDTSYDETASFVVNEIGKHDVKLAVEDEWGCKDSITTGLAAFFRAPNFDLLADSLSCTTHAIEFRNKLHAVNYTYSWSFGDGDTSSLAAPVHLYETEGDYAVSLRIEDDEACINFIEEVQIVQIADPIASFTADSTFTACPPLITTFSNQSLNGVNYLWDFGDESGISSEHSPAHLYITAGVFDVALIVERTPNCRDTSLLADLIQLDGPKGSFTFEIDSSCVPQEVAFEAQLEEDYKLIWDFGDGNLQEVDEKTNFSQISYSYEKPGNFIPKIILEDNEDCKITREGENIEAHDLEAAFTISDSIFCDILADDIVLTNSSFSTSPIITERWMIGQQNYEGSKPEIMLSDTGKYDVTLMVGSAFCSDTIVKSEHIRIGPSPILHDSRDTFNCINTSISLLASSEHADDLISWYDAEGQLLSSDAGLVGIDVQETQNLVIEAINSFLCVDSDTILVELIDDQTDFAGPKRTICHGAELDIEIDYGSDVTWIDDVECRNCSTITLSPDSLTFYPIVVTNEYGCLVRDTLEVDVLYGDDIDAGDDQAICKTESPILLAYAPGQIRWSPENLVADPFATLTYTMNSESMMFYLESTVDECTLKDSVYIARIESAELETRGDTICYGEMAQIQAFGNIDGVQWEGQGLLSNDEVLNPTASPTETMQFQAIGYLAGCKADTSLVEVMVHPEIEAHLPNERNYFQGTKEVEVSVQMSSVGNYSFAWSPPEMVDCANCSSVLIKTQDSSHVVSVEIEERESGCKDTLSVELREHFNCPSAADGIGVPNIFSPNEDGVNDILTIQAPSFEDVNSVSIYDRWGEKVFTSPSLAYSWDGTHRGKSVLPGVYTYLVHATCPDTGGAVYLSGDVTVLR